MTNSCDESVSAADRSMHRVYLRWPVPTTLIEWVNQDYSVITGRSPDYGVDDQGRWYVDVPNANWATALRIMINVHGQGSEVSQ